jgi:uncharacterized membrane protein YhaH (DUF805 family)
MWLRRTIAILLIVLPPFLVLPTTTFTIKLDLPPGGSAPGARSALDAAPAAARIGTYIGYGVAAAIMLLGAYLLVRSFVVKPPLRRPTQPYASLTARLLGRSRRREYWPSIVALTFVFLVLFGIARGSWMVAAGVLPLWSLIALRRVHDFNAVVWWALAIPALDLVLMVIRTIARAGFLRVDPPFDAYATLTAMLASMSFVIIVGIIPGTKGRNRYGPAHNAPAFDPEVFD